MTSIEIIGRNPIENFDPAGLLCRLSKLGFVVLYLICIKALRMFNPTTQLLNIVVSRGNAYTVAAYSNQQNINLHENLTRRIPCITGYKECETGPVPVQIFPQMLYPTLL